MTADALTGIDTAWVILTGAMVFLMEGGFALLEAGLVRRKNAVNVMMKVLADSTFGTLAYWAVGYALMFGTDIGGFIGASQFFLRGGSPPGLHVPIGAFWLYHVAFSIAAASIVSGAVAERVNFKGYVLFSVVLIALLYPISGHWVWATAGWLARRGFLDFAGGAVVHAFGGWAALAAALVLGPRRGKFDGTRNFAPNNWPLALTGTFVLWFGWFGFNAGGTLAVGDLRIALIVANTMLAAAAGGAVAMLYSMFTRKGAVDPGLALNGALAGLVAITPACAFVSFGAAVVMGVIGAILTSWAAGFFESVGVDDPVGAVAVHGVNGLWGTIATGLFATQGGLFYGGGTRLVGVQVLGVLVISAWGFVTTYALLSIIKGAGVLRPSAEEEEKGMDLAMHDAQAYSDNKEAEPDASVPERAQGGP